jgi:hypothetical protein
MSWFINAVGTKAGIKALLESPTNSTVPAGIKAAINEVLDEPPAAGYPQAFSVVGSGHSGGGYGNINELKVSRLTIVADPVAPEPVAAAESAKVEEPAAAAAPDAEAKA